MGRGHRQTVLRARPSERSRVCHEHIVSCDCPRSRTGWAWPSMECDMGRSQPDKRRQERGWPCAWADSCRGTYGEANHRYPYHTNLPDKLCSRCAAASVPCGQPRGGCPGSAGPWGRDGASHRAAASAQRSLTTHEQVRGRGRFTIPVPACSSSGGPPPTRNTDSSRTVPEKCRVLGVFGARCGFIIRGRRPAEGKSAAATGHTRGTGCRRAPQNAGSWRGIGRPAARVEGHGCTPAAMARITNPSTTPSTRSRSQPRITAPR